MVVVRGAPELATGRKYRQTAAGWSEVSKGHGVVIISIISGRKTGEDGERLG